MTKRKNKVDFQVQPKNWYEKNYKIGNLKTFWTIGELLNY